MTNIKNIIKNSLKYFDKNNKKNEKFIHQVKSMEFEYFESDMKRNKITLFDKDKKALHVSRYERIGLYINKYGIWTWAWSDPLQKKNATYLSRKLLEYGFNQDEGAIKTGLITSRSRITNLIQLEINLALASYLTKNSMLFSFVEHISFDGKKVINKFIPHSIMKDIDNDNVIIHFIYLLDEYKE